MAGLSALAVSSIRSSLRTPFAQAWNERWRALMFLLCTGIVLILQLAVLGNRNWEGEGVFLIRIIRSIAAAGLLIVFASSLPLLRRWTLRRILVILFWFSVLLLLCRQNYEQIFSARFNPATTAYVQANISAAPEYFPRWIDPEHRKPSSLQSWSARTQRVRIIGEHGSAQVSRWRSRFIQLRVHLSVPAALEVAQFYYPGWTARLHPGGESLPLRASDDGLLQIDLPAGEHDVQLALDGIPTEKIGSMISAVTVAFLPLLLIRKERLIPAKMIRPSNTTA